MDRDVNVLAFGLPGTGKTHAMCAIGHRLVQPDAPCCSSRRTALVQDMLAAKRDLDLPRMLRKLDNYDLLVIDDLGYLPQGAEESEVLFTLIAERYDSAPEPARSASPRTWSSPSGRRCSLTRWRLLPRSTGSYITRSFWSSTCRATGPVKHRGDRRKNDNYKRLTPDPERPTVIGAGGQESNVECAGTTKVGGRPL